jgi:hypothetical protein
VPDGVGVHQQVRHVGARAQQHPWGSRRDQVALDLGVPALERDRRAVRGPRPRQLDDALDAGRARRVDRRALVADLAGDVAAGQEDAVDALQRPVQRGAVGEVAHRELHVGTEQLGGPVGVAHERAGSDAAVAQPADDVAADGAGRPGDEHVHRAPPGAERVVRARTGVRRSRGGVCWVRSVLQAFIGLLPRWGCGPGSAGR